MLHFLILVLGNVIENPSSKIIYSAGDDTSHISLKNTLLTSKGITMRTTSEKGAILSFKEKNEYKEWSFSATFNFPILYPPQTTSVYLWYTENEVEEGSYKGIANNFNGMGVGIEIFGRAVEIIITKNDGSKIEDENSHFIMRDSVSYERFIGLSEITLKVVSTKKNFSVEIYNKGNLVYDRLRFEDASVLGNISDGKIFSISTEYQRVPLEKKITLYNVVLNERKEEEGYEPLKSEVKSVKKNPRMYYDVNHNDIGVRHLISALETYLTYMKTIIGSPAGISIIKAVNNLREEIENQYNVIKDIKEEVKKIPTNEQTHAFDDVGFRIGNSKIKLQNMEKEIDNFIFSLSEMDHNISKKSKIVNYSIYAAFALVLFYLSISFLKRKNMEMTIPT